MDATRVLYLHHEEFECVLVSQSLPCIHCLIQGSLGPTMRHTLQDYHASHPRITRPNREKIHLLALPYIPPFINKDSQAHRGKKYSFTAIHSLVHGLLGQWLRDPHSGSGTTRPCVFQFRDPPHLASNPIRPSHINHMREPISSNLSRNGRLGLKYYHTWQNPCNGRKETHVIPCMPNLARKIHIQVDTCNETYCSCLISPFPT